VVVGGPFNSGILATGPIAGASYDYAPAPEPVLERVRALERVCEAHGVPLAQAALQFPFGHPAVVSVIPGGQTPDEVERNVATLARATPPALWSDLRGEGLIRADAPLPEA
jgi:D-threo-aldose 1-dehydrogenase